MSKVEDDARMAEIMTDTVAKAVFKVMEKVPMEQRLYPDLYVMKVAQAARSAAMLEIARATANQIADDILETGGYPRES